MFNTPDEAKEYVIAFTNKVKSPHDIDSISNYYRNKIDIENDDNKKIALQKKLDEIDTWKDSGEFKQGNYFQGIDELLFELIEWRAIIYAFQNVDTKKKPFEKSGFYAQWYLGAVYGIFSIIGKLVSKDSRDISLRMLWKDVSCIMLKEGACTQLEFNYIKEAMNEKSGRFTNENSKSFLFRNKLISHNEARPIVKWDDVDKDLSLLIRIWSILIAWSSFGISSSFRTDEQAFLGLESMLEISEIKALREQRQRYFKKVDTWSKCYAHSGKEDPGKGAFSKISIREARK